MGTGCRGYNLDEYQDEDGTCDESDDRPEDICMTEGKGEGRVGIDAGI